jgi:KaiC/GvpD/RAD55 family RecA-like ATPase
MDLVNRRFVRSVTIEKMRSTALEPAQYGFSITSERGIVLNEFAEPHGLAVFASES